MNDTQFMGLLIGCIATLLGIASIIVAIIIRPVINLNKSITKLNDSIDMLNRDSVNLSVRVSKQGEKIDANTQRLIVHDQEIKYLKEKAK